MAHLHFYSGDAARADAIDLSGLADYRRQEFTDTMFRWFDNADDNVVLFGAGLTFSGNGSALPDVTGGRVTGLGLETGDGVVWLFSGLDISARALFRHLAAGDQPAVQALLLSGDDQISGRPGDDALRGGDGDDSLFGLDGDDRLAGNRGNDRLWGGAGRDSLLGGRGDDVLTGHAGPDRLTGGLGADRFVFASAPAAGESDLIVDFAPGEDLLVLNRTALPGIGPDGALDPLRFGLGDAATTNAERILWDATTGLLRHDPDGARAAPSVVIARLGPGLSLSVEDIEVYHAALIG